MDMKLPKDPAMLLSVVNTKLRDQYASLEALCEDMQADQQAVTAALEGIGYSYDISSNRFV